MTDPTTPTDDDLSLALDGEADVELLARIEASPEAQARLDELRAASALVASATVEPLADDDVDRLIATAMDTPIAPSRGASSGRGRATPWLVAASVIILMAVGLSLVWAGRSSNDDQASASRTASDATGGQSTEKSAADTAFSDSAESSGGGSAAEDPVAGGHGAPTTVVPSTSTAKLPVLYLGEYASGDELREATAISFQKAFTSSGSVLEYGTDGDTQTDSTDRSRRVPSEAAVDRCADQLRVTLKLDAAPLQTGYATVDDTDVLVYEFAATSARSDQETTLVAAVGADACNEVVIFER